ncbi:MAG TPA: shikimate dehydrogenase [Candidatus Binatia bacterium]|nr:shikimate dehydrogenase [Candidatus Binatia bacterium]
MPISGRTRVLVIIGDPIAQARAPGLVNAALAERGIDAVMVPLRVPARELAPVVAGWRAVENLVGAVVTMPHKSTVVSLLDELTPEARAVGACNAVRREPDGRLVGALFDGEGFVAGLREAGHDVGGKRVLLLGAGGAASAIAFALAKHGVRAITIRNRSAARAATLADRIRSAWPDVEVDTAAGTAGHELVVNATSLGMRADDSLPVDPDALRARPIVADVVISAEPTPLLAEAARRGCVVHPGLPMLTAQIHAILDFVRL